MSVYTTYADVWRPQEQQKSRAYNLFLILGGSILIALSAQFSFYLPFSPVPVTGQTFAVLFLAALFGSKLGSATVLAYLMEGASGLPVFASGSAGIHVFSGPTGGYLVGFLIAAYVVGWLAEQGWDRRALTVISAMVIGNLIIYACGVTWLSKFLGFSGAIDAGLTPFFAGDVFKIALAATLLPAGWKVLENRRSAD